MKAFYFNFSHDVQLAAGNTLINPSRNVLALEHDLQPLAAWVAEEGDTVIVHPDMVEACRSFYSSKGVRGVEFTPHTNIPCVHIEPWGWDIGVRNRLLQGAKRARQMHDMLPDQEVLDIIRGLSSREIASECLKETKETLPEMPLCGFSRFCQSEEELHDIVDSLQGEAVLKAPWSSSGRGLRFLKNGWDESVTQWALKILHTQGGMEVQSYCRKKSDWAMEFHAHADGQVRYTGLSRFLTSPFSAYCGGKINSQENLLLEWKTEMPISLFEKVKTTLEKILTHKLNGAYAGPLGVDMMSCMDSSGNTMLHPCVEINLRRTMGQIALYVAERVPAWQNSVFEIKHEPFAEKPYSFFQQHPEKYMPLTPLTPQTRFAAYLRKD